ncbi:hypothetical protein SH1V18_41220 [Vallitalea longa]|uniref:HD domain-containing protein n=1 Tax=Vallitalea longa TaxID=2936439 RepID=A0A9W5YCV3_9FIRM|nr:HD domain-containing protein [Vallitalea longa]GKX31642.1 hypothetical protein SH1V18_41220 [Vallitalea longa]
MDSNIIQTVTNIVENQCRKDTNIFGYDIWRYHIKVVVEFSMILADKLDADKEIVELASLLHDYASIKDKKLIDKHHIYGAEEAGKILTRLDYPEDGINKVKECIIQHRGSVKYNYTSKESICVASADAMSHIEHVPSLLKLAYCRKNLSIDDGANWVNDKIDRSWNKLCPEAKDIMQKKYNSVKEILDTYKDC